MYFLHRFAFLAFVVTFFSTSVECQKSELTLDRIYSLEFQPEYPTPIRWIENGDAFISIEYNDAGAAELIKYSSNNLKRAVWVSADELTPLGKEPIKIEEFSLSEDEGKVLIFNNSKRVWRSNSKGDYWVFDRNKRSLKQIGTEFETSSCMFAKFSEDNKNVAFVNDFNLYVEDYSSAKVKQLTFDGNRDIINGTFDWVYEEEFGVRDGFRWSPNGDRLAFWQLDASKIKTFYMINNTDSIYPSLIPLQYPKVGEDPSSCKVGIVNIKTGDIEWINVPGSDVQNYIPAMQWVNKNMLLIQQLNRKQNKLLVWAYIPSSKELRNVYTEEEETWVDLSYPDLTLSGWGENDVQITNEGTSFIRMTENDKWRNVYEINIKTGAKKLLSKVEYDVASITRITKRDFYFMASPTTTTQRYLYRTNLEDLDETVRITPLSRNGINTYNISPNGKYALHTHTNHLSPNEVTLVSLPDHRILNTFVDNREFKKALEKISLPEVEFFEVTTKGGIAIEGRLIKPIDFDPSKKYPVIFHVYGEPWGQVANDSWIGMWNILLAQKGYVVVDLDNRGTPCLKGSEWRKSIYRKIGVINVNDQAQAGQATLEKFDYLDTSRTAVWGWSGGGSMTLNLMFKYPDIYKTGISVAPVSNQLIYDNIYQERYMGLPSENMQDYVTGSPLTYTWNFRGNLLLIHGTADDNVHYQSTELVINKLIEDNKQFDMMSYPNRSHGIYEGKNTRRHLYGLITRYLLDHTPIN